MADPRRRILIEELTDDDSYEPSNEGNPEITIEAEHNHLGKVNGLDYVSADHPLLPLPRFRILDSAEALRNKIRYHSEFWWDVVLAMQERA